MIYFSIILLSISQIILAVGFFLFRRRVRTLFLKIQTYIDLQDIDIDSLKKLYANLYDLLYTLIFK